MSNALDHVRHNCGIAGEEVAEMVDELEQQRDELLAALEQIANPPFNSLPDHHYTVADAAIDAAMKEQK